MLLSGCSPEVERDESGAVTSTSDAYVEDLRAGDCFNDLPDLLMTDTHVAQVSITPCSAAHRYEVYWVFEDGPDAIEWPGPIAVRESATEGCLAAFEGYVGISPHLTLLEVSIITPSEELWLARQRMVYCLVQDPADSERTGSLRGSRR